MLSLVSTEDPPNSRTARPLDPALTAEPGIYAEPSMGGTTLFTFLGRGGAPIGYVMLPGSVMGSAISPELQALYDRCAAVMASSIRTG